MKALFTKLFEFLIGDLEGEMACHEGWSPLDENAMILDGAA